VIRFKAVVRTDAEPRKYEECGAAPEHKSSADCVPDSGWRRRRGFSRRGVFR
jgi:hypothetical protein